MKLYRIKKRNAYYSKNLKGYVTDFVFAGKYEYEDAISECNSCSECMMEEIDNDELIEEINKRIEQLKDYLP